MVDKWQALRDALAAGPTPGPWVSFYKHKYDEWHVSVPVDGSTMKLALFNDGVPTSRPREDAAYLAACDPDTIRALLAAADEEKRRAEMLAGTIDSHNKACLRSCERRRDVGNACTARAWRCSDCPRLYRIDAARK